MDHRDSSKVDCHGLRAILSLVVHFPPESIDVFLRIFGEHVEFPELQREVEGGITAVFDQFFR